MPARRSSEYCNQIKNSELEEKVKSTLLEVFVNWLEQRLKHRGKMEIEKLLLGDLPDLRDTQSGKDLIEIGKIEGLQEFLVWELEFKFGKLAPEVRQRIGQINSLEKLKDLHLQVLKADSIEHMKW